MESRARSKSTVQVIRIQKGEGRTPARRDEVATEEPLEIRLVSGQVSQQLAVTMRTPGADFELAAGFLLAEGIIRHRDELHGMTYCVDTTNLDEAQQYNVVNVSLRGEIPPDLRALQRSFVMTSACGVCGKTSIESVMRRVSPVTDSAIKVSPELITTLPGQLRQAQQLFDTTGGLHAAALFDLHGQLLAAREDVGRHNAMDKLLGWALLNNRLPLKNSIALVSGRASFELVQKAAAGGVSIFCAISAPSSLAVRLARQCGITLIGFLRDERFNLYCGEDRII
jgi:FdhD protein